MSRIVCDSFRTALYLRLSKDDERAAESASITTQRSILQEYARAHGLNVAGEYVDDADIIGLNQNLTPRALV